MNSPDTGIQQLQKVDEKQPEGPLLFGKSSKPKMEEHGPSSSVAQDNIQHTSGQTDSKVSLDFV